MSDNELMAVVAKRELNEFTHKKVLEWASNRLIIMSDELYTVQSELDDIKENEPLLYHLAEAHDNLIYAIQATGSNLKHKNRIVNLDPSNKRVMLKTMIPRKHAICDFVTVELIEHDKMAGRHDKMADFVKTFFTELDKFEEEIYNVI